MSDIELLPLPMTNDPEKTGGYLTADEIFSYARACVLADRAQRAESGAEPVWPNEMRCSSFDEGPQYRGWNRCLAACRRAFDVWISSARKGQSNDDQSDNPQRSAEQPESAPQSREQANGRVDSEAGRIMGRMDRPGSPSHDHGGLHADGGHLAPDPECEAGVLHWDVPPTQSSGEFDSLDEDWQAATGYRTPAEYRVDRDRELDAALAPSPEAPAGKPVAWKIIGPHSDTDPFTENPEYAARYPNIPLYAAPSPDDARDAARYRWMRDVGNNKWIALANAWEHYCQGKDASASVDAAIDAAMQQSTKEGKE